MRTFRFAAWRQAALALSFTACLGAAHAALPAPLAETFAATYTNADLDERQLTYQGNMMVLAAMRAVDAELAKRPAAKNLTPASEAWKQARTEMLVHTAPAASNMADKKAWQDMYQKHFAEAFTPEEAEEVMNFIRSPAGDLYFHARRLKNAEQAVQTYQMALANGNADIPLVVTDEQAQSEVKGINEEAKGLKLPPDAETIAKVNAMNSKASWRKLGEVVSQASYNFMNEISTSGELKDSQGLVRRIVDRALKPAKGKRRGK